MRLSSRIILLGASATLAGCFQHAAAPLPQANASAAERGGVRVTMASGRSLVLYRATLRSDTLWGVTAPDLIQHAVPAGQIARFERISFDRSMTVGTTAFLTVFALIASIRTEELVLGGGARPAGDGLRAQVR